MNRQRGGMLVAILFSVVMLMVALVLFTTGRGHLNVLGARTAAKRDGMATQADLQFYVHNYYRKLLEKETLDVRVLPSILPDLGRLSAAAEKRTGIGHEIRTEVFKVATGYDLLMVQDRIKARSLISGISQFAHVRLRILSGEIPVQLFPFLLTGEYCGSKLEYLGRQRIAVNPGHQVQAGEMNADMAGFLLEAIGNPCTRLSWSCIRSTLGLEICDIPVEEGIYLFQDESEVKAVFIQGDLDNLIFYVNEQDLQVVECTQKGKITRIRYRPGYPEFCLETEDTSMKGGIFEKSFSQVFIVNGSVYSIIQRGNWAFSGESDLVLVVAGEAVIRSSLVSESAGRRCNFTLLRMTNPLVSSQTSPGSLRVEGAGILQIQGSIITDGTLENLAERLEITGNLILGSLINQGKIRIQESRRNPVLDDFFRTVSGSFVKSILVDWEGKRYD